MEKLTAFEASYLETALWSSTDEHGEPLDSGEYVGMECSNKMIARIQKDCADFIVRLEDMLIEPRDTFAHDFWLTRNHHGAGFWDGDYQEPLATQLTNLAHSFGECDIYVGDDNKFYMA